MKSVDLDAMDKDMNEDFSAVEKPEPKKKKARTTKKEFVPGCEECSLNKMKNVQPTYEENAEGGDRILLVTESPTEGDTSSGVLFGGDGGELVNKLLSRYAFSGRTWAATTVCGCYAGRGKQPKVGDIAHCDIYLRDFISAFRPDRILCMGKISAKAILGKEVGNQKMYTLREQSPFEVEIPGDDNHPAYMAEVYVAISPKMVYKEPKNIDDFISDWDFMFNPPERTWIDASLDTYYSMGTPKKIKKELYQYMNVRGIFENEEVALDFETTGLHPIKNRPVTLSLSWMPSSAFVVNLHDLTDHQMKEVLQFIARVLANAPVIYHEAKFDMKFFKHWSGGANIPLGWDTKLVDYVRSGNPEASRGLKYLARRKMYAPAYSKDIVFDGSTPIGEMAVYNGRDTSTTLQLKRLYGELDEREEKLLRYLYGVTKMLIDVELKGAPVNEDWLESRREALEKQVDALQAEFDSLSLNPDSPKQVAEFFKISSSGKDKLAKIDDDVARHILEHRGASKELSTYVTGFSKHILNRRVHTDYRVAGTLTGRLSSRCVPTDTLILTERGWKNHTELSVGERVMGFDIQTEKYEWTILKNIYRGVDVVGRVTISRGHDQKYGKGIYCTEKHRWVVKSIDQDVIGFSSAYNLPRKHNALVLPAVPFPATTQVPLLTEDQAFLLGWYLTDGFITSSTDKNRGGLGINLVKRRSIELLETYLTKAKIPYSKTGYKRDGHHNVTAFHISSKIFTPIFSIFKSYGPDNIVMALSASSKRVMFDAMLEADGSMRYGATRYDRFGALEKQYKRVCEYFELLAVALGQPYTYDNRRVGLKKPFVNYQLLTSPLYVNKNINWKPEFETDVWCPTTGLGTWVMKQGHIIAVTGNSPNMQNLKSDDDEDHNYQAVVYQPPEAKTAIVHFDYSQIEMRRMAVESGDGRLLDLFLSGRDIHAELAQEIFGADFDPNSTNQRVRAKRTNFGIIYGISKYGLAEQLEIEEDEAQSYLDTWYDMYPGVVRWWEGIRKEVRERRVVYTPFGRARYFGLESLVVDERAMQREGINFPIQSPCCDMHLLAALEIYEATGLYPVQLVHDELVYELDKKDIEDTVDYIMWSMRRTAERLTGNVLPFPVEEKK